MKKVKRKALFTVRAKALDTNEWVYGNAVFIGGKAYILSLPPQKIKEIALSALNEYLIEIDSDTLDRNIGEFDLNGTMIFENDIISEKTIDPDPYDPPEGYYLIKWVTEYNAFMAIPIDDGKLIADPVVDCDSMLAIRHTEYYVVGNTHENRVEDFVFKTSNDNKE